eukprot:CAMPEP_0180333880 /NCGR_PEP_ID=MMETSP0988-20121125/43358_1 /TAXON_ID=697907 /ORGANISM="non described non described, Strain CCMP2293" /LENGTH=44 /DNA_ID= /DNA_START= /DNA_END= /DNA_ORIENTATION=
MNDAPSCMTSPSAENGEASLVRHTFSTWGTCAPIHRTPASSAAA